MAIAPPSDLMLDVARAADPAMVREATARLGRLAADPTAPNEGFDKALSAARLSGHAPVAPAAATDTIAGPAMAPMRAGKKGEPEVYRKFEAVLLQNFVESMLPKDAETFGDATSAGVYRSMMAEQLADQISKAGGIGIAKSIEKAHPATHKVADATAPVTPPASS